jgi:hypothetical protein
MISALSAQAGEGFRERIAKGNSALLGGVEDGALFAFVIAAVTNFFDHGRACEFVLSLRGEPCIQ